MEAHPRAPLSFLVERALGAELEAGEVEHARRDLVRRVERKLARSRRNLSGLEERAAAADGAEAVREEGELLKTHLGRWKRGAREVEVEDFFAAEAGARRKIELDPKLAPGENVERVFARYRKLLRVQASAHQDLAYAGERVAELEALLAAAQESDDPAALDEQAVGRGLLQKVQEAPPPPGRRAEPKQRLPYRSFRAAAGGEIRVGRSARDNDELTMRHSKGSDLWLHTADAPGSHVVLCLDKGAEADPEEVLDAAHLAVHFSPLKGARRAAVHVAARKLVHKPKGAKPGLVTLSGGKVLSVRMQPERLERLLGSGRPSAGGEA
jgi:predicted ribosome quality control (RQC) complex YloA/Tae2 family protein